MKVLLLESLDIVEFVYCVSSPDINGNTMPSKSIPKHKELCF